MQQMPDECVDLVVTSPPYDNLRNYKGYEFDFFAIARQLVRVLKQGGVIVWVVADETKNGSESGTSFKQALYFMAKGLYLHDTMIYRATKPPANDNRYQQAFEYMFIFSKGSPKTVNLLIDKKNNWAGSKNFGVRTQRDANGNLKQGKQSVVPEYSRRLNIWEYSTGKGYSASDNLAHKHPAIFPEDLARDHILTWSNPGDLVMDCFSGSGTTLKMAKILERPYLGFDISSEYVELAQRRLESVPEVMPLQTLAASNTASSGRLPESSPVQGEFPSLK